MSASRKYVFRILDELVDLELSASTEYIKIMSSFDRKVNKILFYSNFYLVYRKVHKSIRQWCLPRAQHLPPSQRCYAHAAPMCPSRAIQSVCRCRPRQPPHRHAMVSHPHSIRLGLHRALGIVGCTYKRAGCLFMF